MHSDLPLRLRQELNQSPCARCRHNPCQQRQKLLREATEEIEAHATPQRTELLRDLLKAIKEAAKAPDYRFGDLDRDIDAVIRELQ
jgi:hypothetical protein